ncbi:hypothetical protein [Sphingomonas sp. SAFR-052]
MAEVIDRPTTRRKARPVLRTNEQVDIKAGYERVMDRFPTIMARLAE